MNPYYGTVNMNNSKKRIFFWGTSSESLTALYMNRVRGIISRPLTKRTIY